MRHLDPVGNVVTDSAQEDQLDALQVAMEWQVTLWSGEVTHQEREAFRCWLDSSPAHQYAWQQLQLVYEPFSQVQDDMAGKALRASGTDIQRRKLLLGLFALATIGVSGYGIQRTPQWQSATADYTTRRGETHGITLPDGTMVTLNTNTAIDVNYSASQRSLQLYRGEVMIVTAADRAASPRPFVVSTRNGQIRPIGTRFTVRQHNDDADSIMVQVQEGAVELTPRAGAGMTINAGQQACFDQHQIAMPTSADPTKIAWTRGLLVAEQQKLDDFLTELGRYRSGVLRCDPSVANLVVSGVYPLRDTDQILQALAQALPIRIHTLSRYWVTVSAP